MKFARRDVIRILIVAGFVTQLAPYLGIGDPERRHLYFAAVLAIFLFAVDPNRRSMK